MDNDDVISTVNGLIQTSRDGEQGFRTCAEDVDSPTLKTVFNEAAQRCGRSAAELETKVRAMGGDPATGGSVGGSLHRAWVDIKSKITGKDEKAILEECERGEDAAKRAYNSALEQELPVDIRALVEKQYQGVKQNHDRIRDLRNAYRVQA